MQLSIAATLIALIGATQATIYIGQDGTNRWSWDNSVTACEARRMRSVNEALCDKPFTSSNGKQYTLIDCGKSTPPVLLNGDHGSFNTICRPSGANQGGCGRKQEWDC